MAGAAGIALASTQRPASARTDIAGRIATLASSAGVALGACILDTADGTHTGYRADEPVALCSTFKMPLAAAILREVDHGRLGLDTVLPYTAADLVQHAPVTGLHVGEGGMTVGALARAMQETSDNPAANLLLARIGGPAGFTAFCRETGDMQTRLDRIEPDVNGATPGDPRDTTTPRAMARLSARILTGDTLSPGSRDLLLSWMETTQTGLKRLRAGLPASWRAGDKTGTGINGRAAWINDVAIAFPPRRPPIIITAYLYTTTYDDMQSDRLQAVLADTARLAVEWASRP